MKKVHGGEEPTNFQLARSLAEEDVRAALIDKRDEEKHATGFYAAYVAFVRSLSEDDARAELFRRLEEVDEEEAAAAAWAQEEEG